MKYTAATKKRKQMLADSLKRAIGKKSFSKVTVSEIVEDCGINRKTFYYHFEDLYDLLRWTLEQETIEVLKQFNLAVEYEEAISFVLDYMEQNAQMLNNVYHSVGRDELKRFFYLDFFGLIHSAVDQAEKIEKISVSESFKTFLCQFYTEAVAGILLHWIAQRSIQNREQIVLYTSALLRSGIPSALYTIKQMELSEKPDQQ